MTGLVTEYLPLVAGAPDGIKKLRELILDLAVLGHLVPQDTTEEQADRLLQRIAVEKESLIADGKLKKPKLLPSVFENGAAVKLPIGWAAARLGELVNISTGKLDANAAVVGGAYPFFTCSQTPSRIDTYSYDTSAVLLAGNGDFNLKKYSGRFDAYQRTYVIEPVLWSIDYCFIILSAEIDRVTENNRGSAIPYLKLGDITNPIVHIPPLAEQHRIVAKVDELMALCDRLEADQADAQAAHAQLVQALLGSLTQATDAADFRASWQRLSEHFHTLFTTEASIDALKQTVLQLAVMGKLVAQVDGEGAATELLASIKAKLHSKANSSLVDIDMLPSLPSSWCWTPIAELANIGTGATPSRTNPEYFNPPEISWVTSGETSQAFVTATEQKVSSLALAETNLTVYPTGTLVVAMYGQGKTRGQVTELMIEACTNQACAAIQLVCDDASHRRYVKYFFEKSYDELRALAAGGAQPNLNLGKIKETMIPLPPLAEQHRIVAKVDELMALCDQLKSQLTEARQQHAQLASVLVEQAVAAH